VACGVIENLGDVIGTGGADDGIRELAGEPAVGGMRLEREGVVGNPVWTEEATQIGG